MKDVNRHPLSLPRKKIKRSLVVTKNYKKYIDHSNYFREMTYGRQTDAIATTKILSIDKIIKKFEIEDYEFLNQEEQDVFDIELQLLELDIPNERVPYIISTLLKKRVSRINYLLNRVDAKYYVCELMNGTIPQRKYKNKSKNLKDKIKAIVL